MQRDIQEIEHSTPVDKSSILEESLQMSEPATLGNIILSPEKTFKSIRIKPRFITAGLIIVFLAAAFQILLSEKVGAERMLMEQLNAMSVQTKPTAEQIEKYVAQQNSLGIKAIKYISTTFGLIVPILLGGLFYWLGPNAMGGSASFLRGLSVWIYSSFPPAVVMWLANILVLMLKPVEEISFFESRKGMVISNPNYFFAYERFPLLATFFNSLDIFYLWGLVLAAIGIHHVAKLSKKLSWVVVLVLASLGLATRLIISALTGLPQ